MMGALFQNSFAIFPRGQPSDYSNLSLQRFSKRLLLYCHSNNGGNVTRSTDHLKFSSSSVLSSERSVLISGGNGAATMEKTELAMRELVPNANGSLVQVQEGIGILKFLKGKAFFITGGTGFLAKVLIEKILRTVPDVGKIYVLIKAKNKEAAIKRLKNEIINVEIFKSLQQSHGNSYESFMMSKLVPVVGNVCESSLGLDTDMEGTMADDVDIIINSAANTNFHERYDVAIDINTKGPGRVMAFARKCKKLKLFLQVSTAYVNGQRQGVIMEKPFRIGESIARENLDSEKATNLLPTLHVEDEINLALSSAEANGTLKMKDLGLERARKHGWQDTYVFTKAMGEMLLSSMRGDVPVVILRPSVIESTYTDPFPGWIEGNRMMDPVVTYYGKGHLLGFPVDPNGVIDVVPADMVVNATLAAIAKHGGLGKPEINVYQVASSVVNPLVYKELGDLIYQHFAMRPCLDSKGKPIQVEPFKFFTSIDDFSGHVWKEMMIKIGSSTPITPTSVLVNGNLSRKLEKICKKVMEQAKYLASVYDPYSFYGGRFDNTSTQSLIEEMSEEERKIFYFDVGSINWKDYIMNVHIHGLRRHVMKERGMS
ncbi:hypothetical protein V2J09_006622 [Rumex salicifolius]